MVGTMEEKPTQNQEKNTATATIGPTILEPYHICSIQKMQL